MKKHTFKLFILSIRNNSLSILFLLFLFFLVTFSKSNLIAAKSGLVLWASCIIPAIFPFLIATELLNYTNVAHTIGTLLNKLMRPLFNVPGEGAYAFFLGIISGYPVGAKIVTDLYNKGICNKKESERLLAFTNNSGPLFILGTVGISLFGNAQIGILLLLTHIFSCITVGILIGIYSKFKEKYYFENFHIHKIKKVFNRNNEENFLKDDYKFSDLGELLGNSINKSISTILIIGGFIVLFSVILSILDKIEIIDLLCNFLSNFGIKIIYSKSIFNGLLELTNGLNCITSVTGNSITVNIVIAAFLLGFGGISIMLQVFSIISKFKLSIKPYIIGKFLQGIIASIYTYIFIKNFIIFNFDIF